MKTNFTVRTQTVHQESAILRKQIIPGTTLKPRSSSESTSRSTCTASKRSIRLGWVKEHHFRSIITFFKKKKTPSSRFPHASIKKNVKTKTSSIPDEPLCRVEKRAFFAFLNFLSGADFLVFDFDERSPRRFDKLLPSSEEEEEEEEMTTTCLFPIVDILKNLTYSSSLTTSQERRFPPRNQRSRGQKQRQGWEVYRG